MRILLDTHVLLWALFTPERLPKRAAEAIETPENSIVFSAVNIWEIAIKRALNRADFTVEPDRVRWAALSTDFTELPVSGLHAQRVRHLPPLHRDPFDRLLVAQAQAEPLVLMSNDPAVADYEVNLWHV